MSEKESLQARIIRGFEDVQETEFWPSHITETSSMLTAPMTFGELNNMLTNERSNVINSIERDASIHMRNYRSFITDLDQLKNVFSFDVDFI